MRRRKEPAQNQSKKVNSIKEPPVRAEGWKGANPTETQPPEGDEATEGKSNPQRTGLRKGSGGGGPNGLKPRIWKVQITTPDTPGDEKDKGVKTWLIISPPWESEVHR